MAGFNARPEFQSWAAFCPPHRGLSTSTRRKSFFRSSCLLFFFSAINFFPDKNLLISSRVYSRLHKNNLLRNVDIKYEAQENLNFAFKHLFRNKICFLSPQHRHTKKRLESHWMNFGTAANAPSSNRLPLDTNKNVNQICQKLPQSEWHIASKPSAIFQLPKRERLSVRKQGEI